MMKTLWKQSTYAMIFHREKLLHQHSLAPVAGLKQVRVEESHPLFPLNFDVRLVGPPIPIYQLSIGPERSTVMSAREFTYLPAAIQHQKTCWGSCS